MLPALSKKQQKREWNASTIDELHPFPQRALMHTNSRYNGVEVVPTYFPHRIKGSTYLRMRAAGQSVPLIWTENKKRSKSTHRYTYHCAALESDEESDNTVTTTATPPPMKWLPSSSLQSGLEPKSLPCMNFLAETVIDDAGADKKFKEERWCTSVELARHRRDLHYAVPRLEQEVDVSAINKDKWRAMKSSSSYIPPSERVRRHNEELYKQKLLRKVAEEEDDLAPYRLSEAPAVYKMSNIDEWIELDPVATTQRYLNLMNELNTNTFSRFAKKSLANATIVSTPTNTKGKNSNNSIHNNIKIMNATTL